MKRARLYNIIVFSSVFMMLSIFCGLAYAQDDADQINAAMKEATEEQGASEESAEAKSERQLENSQKANAAVKNALGDEAGELSEVVGKRLMVLPLTPNGVSDEVAGALSEMLYSELEKAQLYDVISRKDLQIMLSNVEMKQMMGVESEKELAAMAEKLDTNYLLRGSVGRVGSTYLINLSLMDVKNARIIRRVQQTVAGDPDNLVGSMSSAVVALALEEEGVPPKITESLVDSLNIARKNKSFWLRFMAGYEMPVGPVVDDATLAYILPGLMNLKLSASYQVLPFMQLVFETGASLSIMEEFAMQNKHLYARNIEGKDYSGSSINYDSEPEVTTTQFDYSTYRIPFNFMVRFQPKTGRLLPYVQTGLGISYQSYTLGDEDKQLLYTDVSLQEMNSPACPAPYTMNADGRCTRDLTMKPENSSINYFNLQFPIAAGVDYLITHHFGMGVEARYLLTYSFKGERDMDANFLTDSVSYDRANKTNLDNDANNDAVTEIVGDSSPIRKLHHGISVMVAFFYYY